MARKKKAEVEQAETVETAEVAEAPEEPEPEETEAEAEGEAATADGADDIVREKWDERELRVDLTDAELIEQGKKIAEAMEAWDNAERGCKAAKAHYKSVQEEADGKMKAARQLLRNGYDYRTVAIKKVTNWTAKTVMVVRDDTGEIIEERDMYPSEMQMPIPGSDDDSSDEDEDAADDGQTEMEGLEGEEPSEDDEEKAVHEAVMSESDD